MNDGDVLLLDDGRLCRIVQKDAEMEHICEGIVQFIDRTEETYVDLETLNVRLVLGNTPEVVASFYASWGMHKRLNILGIA